MPLPCPCCRATNDAGPACRRCKADLSLLFVLNDQRVRLVSQAQAFVAQGRPADAVRTLDEADAIRAGADTARLRAAAHLLNRDFPLALACYSAAANGGPT